MNDTTKQAIPMDLHNCFRIEDADKTYAPNAFRVFPFMRPLITKLVRKHPDWRFISTSYHRGADPDGAFHNYSRFHIEQDGERLGYIDCETRTHGMSFIFDNQRLKAKRQRGHNTGTTDLAKAYKLINENIYGETLGERVTKAISKTTSAVSQMRQRASGIAMQHRNGLVDSMRSFVEVHWEDFCEMPLPPEKTEMRNAYLQVLQDERDANKMSESKTPSGAGATILILADGKYAVAKEGSYRMPNEAFLRVFSQADVPKEIRTKIGMLKLLEGEKVTIPDVGTRVDANTFFVIIDDVEGAGW